MIRCELVRLVIDERCDAQTLVLRDGRRRALAIPIGIFEASAIDRILKGARSERPLTHDLLSAVIAALGARLLRVEIDARRGDIFYAKLRLRDEKGGERAVDCRPSDAVALALREEAPIYVAEDVLEERSRPE